MQRYLTLLKTQPIVRTLASIQLIGYLGTWFSMVAIYVLMSKLGATPTQIALVAIMSFLPGVIQAPIAGAIIDRFSFKPLMLLLLSVELIATFFILFIDSIEWVWVLLFLLFIRMSAGSFYFTAEMSLMPQVVQGEQLKTANDLHSMIWALTYTAGMALGGVVVDFWGVEVAIILDVLLFAICLVIFSQVTINLSTTKSDLPLLAQIIDGVRYLKTHKKVIYLLILHSSVGLTAYDALVALLAEYAYKEIISIALAIGSINAVRATGLFIGPIIVGRYITKDNLDVVMFLQAFFILLWGVTQPYYYLSLAAVFFTGFLTTSIWSLTYAMLQEETDKRYLGRIISYNEMGFMLMSAASSFLIGFLFEKMGFSLVHITYILALLFAVMALYYRRIKPHYTA